MYGAGQGEMVACGVISAATPPVLSSAFGCKSPVRNAKGDLTITLTNEADKAERVVIAACGTSPNTTAVNEAGGTDSTANFLTVDAAGAAADGIVNFAIFRSNVGAV